MQWRNFTHWSGRRKMASACLLHDLAARQLRAFDEMQNQAARIAAEGDPPFRPAWKTGFQPEGSGGDVLGFAAPRIAAASVEVFRGFSKHADRPASATLREINSGFM